MIRVDAKITRSRTLVRLGSPVFEVILIVLLMTRSVAADEQVKPIKPTTDTQHALPNQPAQTEAQQYCVNITGAAVDARYAWQAKKLAELEAQIKSRIAELEAKQAEYKDWIDRREALAKKAEENLVGIYAHMRPEVAATQLAALDDDMAAAVLGQLNPRIASAILNEFQPEQAARLANVMAGRPIPPADGKKM
jgi:flagellar motility protein MotE (MotC chaperone)